MRSHALRFRLYLIFVLTAFLPLFPVQSLQAQSTHQQTGSLDFNQLTGVTRNVGTPLQLRQNILNGIRNAVGEEHKMLQRKADDIHRNSQIWDSSRLKQRKDALTVLAGHAEAKTGQLQSLINANPFDPAKPPLTYREIRMAIAAYAIIGGYDMVVSDAVYRRDVFELTDEVTKLLMGQ